MGFKKTESGPTGVYMEEWFREGVQTYLAGGDTAPPLNVQTAQSLKELEDEACEVVAMLDDREEALR
jgi:hypothetical protein